MLKKILFYLVICYTLPLFGQWQTVNTGSSNYLNGVHSFDQNTWFIGLGGETLKTTNAGNTWTSFPLMANGLPLFGYMTDFHFSSATNGLGTGFFSAGNDELIAKTTNGAQNWTLAHFDNTGNYPNFLNDLFFLPNNNDGWAVGTNGNVYRTTNGGSSWNLIPFPTEEELTNVAFLDSQIGFVGGDNGLYKTINGGQTWTLNIAQSFVTSIQFLDAQKGFVAGYNLLQKTTNAGQTWTTMPLPTLGVPIEKIWFADENFGYLLSYNSIYRTQNAGLIWEKCTEGASVVTEYNDFAWFDKNRGMLVGDLGLCLKTTNGGAGNWAPIASFEKSTDFSSCPNVPQNLINTTPNVPTYTYKWYLNNILFSTVRNPTITLPNFSTNYQVKLVAMNGAAVDSFVLDISTVDVPILYEPDFLSNTTELCEGDPLYLFTSNYLQQNTKWEYYANGVLIDTTLFGYFEKYEYPSVNTTYRIFSRLNYECGSVEVEDEITVNVTPLPTNATFQAHAEKPLVCSGDSALILIENSLAGASYLWNYDGFNTVILGTGGTIAFETDPIFYYTYFDILVSNLGCIRQFNNVASVDIDPFGVGQASLYYSQTVDLPFSINSYSFGANIDWNLGLNAQPPTSNEISPTVVYNTTGLYTAKQVVSNTLGCSDSSSVIIEVFPKDVFPTESVTTCASSLTDMNFINSYLIENILDTYTDIYGNTYVVGYKYEQFSWWSSYNLFYNKYDVNGQLVWARYWPASSHQNSPFDYYYQCIGTSIAADAEGNVYIGGTHGGPRMQIGDNIIFNSGGSFEVNSFIAKLNQNGEMIWVSKMFGVGGATIAAPTDIYVENNNQLTVLMSGRFTKIEAPNETILPTDYAILHGIHFSLNGEVLKYQAIATQTQTYDGEIYADYNPDNSSWYGSRITRVAPRMQKQTNGDWVLSAFFKGEMKLGTTVLTANPNFIVNSFALRIDADFNVKKAFETFSTSDNYQPNTGQTIRLINLPFTTDADGNLYQSVSLGASEYNWGSSPGGTQLYLNDDIPEFGYGCHYLLKFSPDGQLLWKLQSGNAFVSHLAPQPDGSFWGMADYSNTLGLNTRSGQKYGKTGTGMLDLALIHWSKEGEVLSIMDLSTPKYDHGNWFSSTEDGRLVVLYSQNGNYEQGDTTPIRLSVFAPSGLCPIVLNPDIVQNKTAILSISPNPANEQISLQWDDKTAIANFVEVRDVLGKIVFKEKITDNVDGQVLLNLNGFEAGIFGISLFFEKNKVLLGKFVKI
jgi:photosystem II stability/assembly factor-like uncharacterized protein